MKGVMAPIDQICTSISPSIAKTNVMKKTQTHQKHSHELFQLKQIEIV